MRQHENRCVIRRLVAPPPLPAIVGPRTSDRTEHIAPENPGADSGKALLGDRVVDSALSIVMSVHPPPRARVKEPFHQLGTVGAERMLKVLIGAGTVAVDGNSKALNAKFRHGCSCGQLKQTTELRRPLAAAMMAASRAQGFRGVGRSALKT